MSEGLWGAVKCKRPCNAVVVWLIQKCWRLTEILILRNTHLWNTDMPVWGVSLQTCVCVYVCYLWLELWNTCLWRRITHISKYLHKVLLCQAFFVHFVCVTEFMLVSLCDCVCSASAYLCQSTPTPLFSTSQPSTMRLNRVVDVSFRCQASEQNVRFHLLLLPIEVLLLCHKFPSNHEGAIM